MNNDNNGTENIINSVNGIKKAEMPPYFYTRLIARMENELVKEPKPFFIIRPAFLSACLLIVFTFNLVALKQRVELKKQSAQHTATIDNFANDYNLNTESVYE